MKKFGTIGIQKGAKFKLQKSVISCRTNPKFIKIWLIYTPQNENSNSRNGQHKNKIVTKHQTKYEYLQSCTWRSQNRKNVLSSLSNLYPSPDILFGVTLVCFRLFSDAPNSKSILYKVFGYLWSNENSLFYSMYIFEELQQKTRTCLFLVWEYFSFWIR